MSAIALGLVLGAIFGAAARAGRFCLLRGMKGLWPGGDLDALRAFALAAAVALAGTQVLNLAGGTALDAALPVLMLAGFALPLIRNRRSEAAMAAIVGAVVVAGWWATFATDDPFDPRPLTSLSYVGPMGESVLWLLLSTGRQPVFGVAVVGGTLAGAFVVAVLTRSLRAESFGSARQTVAAALGGALMGFGGVLALGCSIGQGLSGLSTLSLASLIAFAGILAGITAGLAVFRQPAVAERT